MDPGTQAERSRMPEQLVITGGTGGKSSHVAGTHTEARGLAATAVAQAVYPVAPRVLWVSAHSEQPRRLAVRCPGVLFDSAADLEAAEALLSRRGYALLCLDLDGHAGAAGLDGSASLALAARWQRAGCQLLLLSKSPTVEMLLAALRLGVVDVLRIDSELPRLLQRLRALSELPAQAHEQNLRLAPKEEGSRTLRVGGVVTCEPVMRRVLALLRDLSQSDAPVLIQGESGSGKSRLVRLLHELSSRHSRQLLTLSCVGLSASRLSEVVQRSGHVGALLSPPASSKPWSPEAAWAAGGMLVLDEVTALDAAAQAELLRTLHLLPELSSCTKRGPRLRLCATASDDLANMVRLGRFRADLYHRLVAGRVELPPLRSRREDLPLLIAEFWSELCERYGRTAPQLHPEVMRLLVHHPWPGNLRELQQVLELLLLRARTELVTARDLDGLLTAVTCPPRIEIPIGSTLEAAERVVILQTLAAQGGNKAETAALLCISRRTLYDKLNRYQEACVETPEPRPTKPRRSTLLPHLESASSLSSQL